MTSVPLRRLSGVAAALCLTSACSPLPTQPSGRTRDGDVTSTLVGSAPVWLSNLTGKYVGRADELCEPEAAPMAIDQLSLTFQIHGVNLAGALLVNCDTPECQNGVPLGTVTECLVPPSPCDLNIRMAMAKGTAPACLTGDPANAGSLDVLAVDAPDGSSTYHVTAYFAASGDHSNTVSTTVERPDTASKDSTMSSIH